MVDRLPIDDDAGILALVERHVDDDDDENERGGMRGASRNAGANRNGYGDELLRIASGWNERNGGGDEFALPPPPFITGSRTEQGRKRMRVFC